MSMSFCWWGVGRRKADEYNRDMLDSRPWLSKVSVNVARLVINRASSLMLSSYDETNLSYFKPFNEKSGILNKCWASLM